MNKIGTLLSKVFWGISAFFMAVLSFNLLYAGVVFKLAGELSQGRIYMVEGAICVGFFTFAIRQLLAKKNPV